MITISAINMSWTHKIMMITLSSFTQPHGCLCVCLAGGDAGCVCRQSRVRLSQRKSASAHRRLPPLLPAASRGPNLWSHSLHSFKRVPWRQPPGWWDVV